MYVCIYIYMYIYIYVCMCVYIYIYVPEKGGRKPAPSLKERLYVPVRNSQEPWGLAVLRSSLFTPSALMAGLRQPLDYDSMETRQSQYSP